MLEQPVYRRNFTQKVYRLIGHEQIEPCTRQRRFQYFLFFSQERNLHQTLGRLTTRRFGNIAPVREKGCLNFLYAYAAQAIRAKNSKDDIYWCSSNNSTVCAIQSISVPVLFMTMGGHYYVGDGERYLEAARSKDKDFVVIEGATHGVTPCTRCERTPGQYANTVKNLFDYTAKWINDRF
jgi:hypothetical protein